jgi:hypothetical protein
LSNYQQQREFQLANVFVLQQLQVDTPPHCLFALQLTSQLVSLTLL